MSGIELRHAWRGLRRDRGFTAVVLLSLALGIGANTAVFSLVDQLLLRLLPVKAPEALVQLTWRTAALLALGLALALPAAWALGRLVESQLFGVRAMDPLTVGPAAALVGAVALLASALPARRASAVDPTEALRAE